MIVEELVQSEYTLVKSTYVGDAEFIWHAYCNRCDYQTGKQFAPGHAESAVRQHLKDKHGVKL